MAAEMGDGEGGPIRHVANRREGARDLEKKDGRRIFDSAKKRSITIAGHQTSIRIESLFWDALLRDSQRAGLPVSAVVARIDAERLAADNAPNLASAIRLWLFARATDDRSE